jgi:predicted DNA-binding transcriptional regulator AlpA
MSIAAEVSREKTSIVPRLMGVADAARYLGISAKTIRNRLGPRAKEPFPIRPKRIGRRVVFDRADLDAFADSL